MAAGSPLLRDQMCPSGSEGTKGSGGGQALCQCRGLGWPFRAQLSGLSPGTGSMLLQPTLQSGPALPLWAPTERQFLDPELERQKGTAGLQWGGTGQSGGARWG